MQTDRPMPRRGWPATTRPRRAPKPGRGKAQRCGAGDAPGVEGRREIRRYDQRGRRPDERAAEEHLPRLLSDRRRAQRVRDASRGLLLAVAVATFEERMARKNGISAHQMLLLESLPTVIGTAAIAPALLILWLVIAAGERPGPPARVWTAFLLGAASISLLGVVREAVDVAVRGSGAPLGRAGAACDPRGRGARGDRQDSRHRRGLDAAPAGRGPDGHRGLWRRRRPRLRGLRKSGLSRPAPGDMAVAGRAAQRPHRAVPWRARHHRRRLSRHRAIRHGARRATGITATGRASPAGC